MSSRYDTAGIIKDKFGKSIISTNIISVDKSNDDIYIRITSPQRIDILAYEMYGDVNEWHKIAAANGLGKGSLWIPSDSIIRIPKSNNINSFIRTKNTTR